MNKLEEQEKKCLDAVGNRCSISDNSLCVDCKAVHESCVYIRMLETENEKLKYVLGRFEEWWSEECPWCSCDFCPCFDELKKEYDEDPHNSEYAYDPMYDCGHECNSGWCWVKYYEMCFDNMKDEQDHGRM